MSIPIKDAIERVNEILKLENFYLNNEIVKELVVTSEGDMRKCINILQGLYLRFKSSNSHDTIKELSVEDFYRIVGGVSPNLVEKVLKILLEKNFEEGRKGWIIRNNRTS